MLPVFNFRILAKAGLANDGNGNKADCFTQVRLGGIGTIEKDEYGHAHEVVKELVSNQINVPIEYIECISQEEYDANHEEE